MMTLLFLSHRTDWGLRSFAVADPSSWNALPVGLRSSPFGLDTSPPTTQFDNSNTEDRYVVDLFSMGVCQVEAYRP